MVDLQTKNIGILLSLDLCPGIKGKKCLTFADLQRQPVVKLKTKSQFIPRQRFTKRINSRSKQLFSLVCTQSQGEPVDELNDRHKADSKTESTNATHVGDEVMPGHLP